MKYAITIILSAPISLYILWLYFLAVMALKSGDRKRPIIGVARWIALSMKYTGFALDAFCNIVWMTILFRELPKEWLVTDRVSRHKRNGDRIATWMCEVLLDPFDEPCHCK